MRTKLGFTLVELMVIVVIVGILAAIAVPLYNAVREKAVVAEPLGMIAQVNVAGQGYMAEGGVDASGFTDLNHLKSSGFLEILSLDGTYFNNSDYKNWQFSANSMVVYVEAGDWAITWDDSARKYYSKKK